MCTLHINVNFLILHHLYLIQSKFNAYFNFLNFLQPYNYHYLNVLFYLKKNNEVAGSVVKITGKTVVLHHKEHVI